MSSYRSTQRYISTVIIMTLIVLDGLLFVTDDLAARAQYGPVALTNATTCNDIASDWTLAENTSFDSGNCTIEGNVTVPAGLTLSLKGTSFRIGARDPNANDLRKMLVKGNLSLDNSILMRNGEYNWTVDVQNGGNLTISNNSLFMNASVTMFTMAGGNLSVKDSTFTDANNYLFDIRNVNSVVFENNSFSNSKWACISSQYAINYFKKNIYTNCFSVGVGRIPSAIAVMNGQIGMESDSFVSNPIDVGCIRCTGNIRNTTFSGLPGEDFYLWGAMGVASILYLFNSPYAVASVDTAGMTLRNSVLYSQQDLDIELRWESDGTPVKGALVNVTNVTSEMPMETTTNDHGRVDDLNVTRMVQTFGAKTNHTPHNVLFRSERWGRTFEQNTTIDLSLTSLLTFFLDDKPPVINVSTPSDGTLTKEKVITVAGETDPPTIDRPVILKVMNGKETKLLPVSQNGSFEATVGLPYEGSNQILLESKDWNGNLGERTINVTRDTVAPQISMTSPSPQTGSYTNDKRLEVSGRTEPGANLTVANTSIDLSADGTFSTVLLLDVGMNTYLVNVTDKAGNANSTSVSMTLDIMPPRLTIDRPNQRDVRTKDRKFTIAGRVDADCSKLTINDELVPFSAYAFSMFPVLKEGLQRFTVTAYDKAGNNISVELNVTLDTMAPILVLSEPTNGAVVNSTKVAMMGTTEPGALLTIEQVDVPVMGDGKFYTTFALAEGPNDISIRVKDALGNAFALTLRITRDTLPPEINIERPLNGTLTNARAIILSGSTEDGAGLMVDGAPLILDSGRFSKDYRLVEGWNAILLTATDGAGNKAEATIMIFRDSVATLVLDGPKDGFVTNLTTVNVSGSSEKGARVVVNGVNGTLDREARFDIMVELETGWNQVNITVVDQLGNEAQMVVYVRYKPDGTNGGGGGGGGNTSGDDGNDGGRYWGVQVQDLAVLTVTLIIICISVAFTVIYIRKGRKTT